MVRRERLFRERCVQCGIEVDKPDAWNTARAKCLSIVDQRWFPRYGLGAHRDQRLFACSAVRRRLAHARF